MNLESYFKEMYFAIWQGDDPTRINEFYEKNFEETISTSDENKEPVILQLNYHDLIKQTHRPKIYLLYPWERFGVRFKAFT